MKAITLWPEWAWAVVHLDKRVENRTWRPPPSLIGQRIGIHAGKHIGGRYTPGHRMRESTYNKALRCIDDVARMADAAGWIVTDQQHTWLFHPQDDPDPWKGTLPADVSFKDGMEWLCRGEELSHLPQSAPARSALVATAVLSSVDRDMRTGWDVPGAWHWRLDDVAVLDPPRPMGGRQGLWEVAP